MLEFIVTWLSDVGGFEPFVARFLVNLMSALLLILGAIVLRIFFKGYLIATLKRGRHAARADTVGGLISSSVNVLIGLLVFLLILDIFDIDATPILASAGIFGLAIGFGAQNLVKDIVSGFFIVVDNAFNLGETVEINGYRGKVTFMNLRVTHVTNFLGSELIINNGSIGQLINWSRNQTTALVDFGVHYDTDLAALTQLMPAFCEQCHNEIPEITETPLFLGVTDLADSSINLRLMAKTKTGEQFGVERKIRLALVAYLKTHQIEIPFPQLVVHHTKDV